MKKDGQMGLMIKNMFSRKESEFLYELKKCDEDAFFQLLRKLVRVKTAEKTGNASSWKRILEEERKNLDSINQELDDKKKIAELEKKIKNG